MYKIIFVYKNKIYHQTISTEWYGILRKNAEIEILLLKDMADNVIMNIEREVI